LVLLVFSKELRKPCKWIFIALVLLYFSGTASKFSAYKETLFSRRQGPVNDRKNIYYASFRMFLAKPVLGFGYGNYLRESGAFFTEIEGVELRGEGEGQHNTLLGVLSEMGLVGAIPFCGILYLLIRTCLKAYRSCPLELQLERSFAATQVSLLLGLAVYMQFTDIRFYSFINSLMFWMTGMVYSISRPSGNEGALTGRENWTSLAIVQNVGNAR
jgi:O-antigen ligase